METSTISPNCEMREFYDASRTYVPCGEVNS